MKLYDFYTQSPVFVQNLLCSTYGLIEAKKRFGGNFKESLDRLIDTQYYSKKEIDSFKKDKLSKVLLNAKNHSFYENKIICLDSQILNHPFDVLANQPILYKDSIISFDMDTLRAKNNRIYSTSGTTGKSLKICKDNESIMMQWAVWMRHRDRFGVKLNDLSVNFTGKPIVPESQTSPPFWRYNRAQNQYLISSKHINEKNIKSIVKFLNSIRPIFYSGYPSIISELSRLALAHDLNLSKCSTPKVIFCGAENLLDYQEVAINNWISTTITDQYGLTEGNCNFSKCEYGYYHEDFEFCHIELSNARKLPDGSMQGNLIGTAFYNDSFPLIRYDTGDIATFAPTGFVCKCGRNSQVILSVEGRKDDYLITPDGRRVMRFGYLFRDTFEALEVQIIQEKPHEVIFKTVLSGKGNIADFEKKVTSLFKEYISTSMLLNFEYVESIERTSTGKFKAVLNRIV